MPAVTSSHNPVVARVRAVARGDLPEFALLDGTHLVNEAVAAGMQIDQAVVAVEALETPDISQLVERLRLVGVPVLTASARVMAAVSPVRSASPIAAIARRPAAAPDELYRGVALVLIAIDIQDPGNLGAIIRVGEASGATGVVVAGSSADPFGWKALRGAMGSACRVPIVRQRDSHAAIADARRHGCRILATAPRGGREPFDIDLSAPIAILVGAEGAGLSPADIAAADERITIPMQAPVESLNAAVTAALVAYEARRQRSRGGRLQPAPPAPRPAAARSHNRHARRR